EIGEADSLDGNDPADRRVLRAIHDAHRAAAEFAEYLIAADLLHACAAILAMLAVQGRGCTERNLGSFRKLVNSGPHHRNGKLGSRSARACSRRDKTRSRSPKPA